MRARSTSASIPQDACAGREEKRFARLELGGTRARVPVGFAPVSSPAPDAPAPRRLRRLLGLGFGLAVTVGSTIGVGILRTPGSVAANLHSSPAILALWVFGGLYTMLGAACLAELGAMLPQAGGYYVY